MLGKEFDDRRRRILWYFAVATVSTAVGLLYLPPNIPAFSMELDDSWQAALHLSYDWSIPFGASLAFPHGPLGILLGKRAWPSTYGMIIAGWSFISVATVIALVELGKRARTAWLVWLVWALVLAVIAGSGFFSEAAFFALPALYLALRLGARDDDRSDAEWLLVAAIAVGCLVKFSYWISGFAAVGFAGIDDAFFRRRIPAQLLLLVFGVVGVWLLCGQPLGAFPQFVWNSIDLSRAYSDAMSAHTLGMERSALESVAYIVASGLVVAFVATLPGATRGTRSTYGVAIAFVLFVGFKAGFVRQDAHVLLAADVLVLAALALVPLGLSARREARTAAMMVAVVCTAVFLAFGSAGGAGSIYSAPGSCVKTAWTKAVTYAGSASQPSYFEDIARSWRATLRREYPLNIPDGGVDVMPFRQTVLLANSFEWRPRPVLQSYSAFTSRLALADADFFLSERAPQTLLMRTETIDERYPSLDDGLALPSILSRYELAESEGYWLELRRAAVPRDVRLEPFAESDVAMGSVIAVPDAGGRPIWVEIDAKKSIAGRIVSVAYKCTTLKVFVTLADGTTYFNRIVIEPARSGFLLSPYLDNPKAAASLFKADNAPIDESKRVVSIAVSEHPRTGFLYSSNVHVRFSRLMIGQPSP